MDSKPLASLCIQFYNQENFVEDTLRGAFSQTYDNLEIVLSDDGSTDHTFEIIQKIASDYKGSHKVIINRNSPNMGIVPHVNKVINDIAKGELIFLNGGDDISTPDRVKMCVDYFLQNNEVTAVTCSTDIIDKNGNKFGENIVPCEQIISLTDDDYLLSSSFMTGGAGLSFRRSVLDKFGRMNDNCQTEDSVLRFRALLLGKTLISPCVGLKYRVHDTNISNNIYKLKTEPIAEQYREDLEKVKDGISTPLYNVLNKKVSYYTRFRNIQALADKRNILIQKILGLWVRAITMLYRKSIASEMKMIKK